VSRRTGTPGGKLLRRYWTPLPLLTRFDESRSRRSAAREDLIVYRISKGATARRGEVRAPQYVLEFGSPTRRAYGVAITAGSTNETGQCRETPLEPVTSNLASKMCIKAYPVRELGAPLRLSPARACPLLPRLEPLVWPGASGKSHRNHPCNWLQCVENALDLGHTQYLTVTSSNTHWRRKQVGRPGACDLGNGSPASSISRPRSTPTASSSAMVAFRFRTLQAVSRLWAVPCLSVHDVQGAGEAIFRGEFQIRVPSTTYHVVVGYQSRSTRSSPEGTSEEPDSTSHSRTPGGEGM